jgi:predicted HTH domain antitoxin
MRVCKLALSEEMVVEAFNNGASLKKIAELHGVHMTTVRNFLLSKGIKMRPKGRRANKENKNELS